MLYEKKKINLKQLIKIVYPNFIRRCIQFYAFLFFTFSLKAQTQSAYFIGNSVTDAINLDGLKEIVASTGGSLSTGRHMIPGAPLDWIFTHPKDGFSNDQIGRAHV